MNKSIQLSVSYIFFGMISILTHAETKDEVKFGAKGGLNTSTTLVSLPTPEYYAQYNAEYKYNVGFNAGMFVEFPLTKILSFQPELTLSVKGMRNESFISNNNPASSGYGILELHALSKISLYYIELPLYLKFGFDLNNSGRLIAGIGPYFAYGIYGKMNTEFVFSAVTVNHWVGGKNIFKEDDLNFNENELIYDREWSTNNVISWIKEPYWHKSVKRFEGGISGFVGYELYKKWLITVAYDMGLINFLNPAEKWGEKLEGKMYNRTFSISLGYKF